jgi:hypothetical protein
MRDLTTRLEIIAAAEKLTEPMNRLIRIYVGKNNNYNFETGKLVEVRRIPYDLIHVESRHTDPREAQVQAIKEMMEYGRINYMADAYELMELDAEKSGDDPEEYNGCASVLFYRKISNESIV